MAIVQAFYQEYCINLTLIEPYTNRNKANSADFDLTMLLYILNTRKKS